MTAAAQAEQVEERLAAYARVTRAAMEGFLTSGPSARYLSELVCEYPSRAGKGIRPALLLASCQVRGGSLADALGAAVALEMLHNAFLIHDDVEDASTNRRGAPTLHEAHGVGLAVNAGDALAAQALEPLIAGGGLGSRVSTEILRELLTMVRQTTEGQALELGWRRENVVDIQPAEYLGLAARKTCWYTTVAPLRLGAIIGSHGTAPLAALSRFGLFLGVAFQIRDDLLSPVGDLIEGKRTLMLIHLLGEAGPADRTWLIGYLAEPDATVRQSRAPRVLELMEAHGSLAFAREYAATMAQAACDVFDEAFAGAHEGTALRFLRGLIPYVVARAA